MKRLSLSITALALSGAFAISSIVPAAAMPVIQPQVKQSSDVETVATHHSRKWIKHHHRGWRGHYVRRGHHYWHGHRGYRYYRPGYRRYHGFWFPPAAFAAGVVIGTTIHHHRRGSAHVRWCRNHYISYRVSDDTYQPYHGPRRRCISP
jgi:hypothetical protein